MRALALLLSCVALSCAPLYSPSGCPRPCPSGCPESCLPSGYCTSARWSPPAAPPLTQPPNGVVDIGLGNLPPGAPLALSIHSVLDLAQRAGATPWDYNVQLLLEPLEPVPVEFDLTVFSATAFNAVDFPLVGDWSGAAKADGNGTLAIQLYTRCQERAGRPGDDCLVLLPAFEITATLLDPTPWEAAPACE